MLPNEICRLLLKRKKITVPQIQEEFSLSYSEAHSIVDKLVRGRDFTYEGGVIYCRTKKTDAQKPPLEREIKPYSQRERKKSALFDEIFNHKDEESKTEEEDVSDKAEEEETASGVLNKSDEEDGNIHLDEMIARLKDIKEEVCGQSGKSQKEGKTEDKPKEESEEAKEERFGCRRFEPSLIVSARQLHWQRGEDSHTFYMFINMLEFEDGTDFKLKVTFTDNGKVYLWDDGRTWAMLSAKNTPLVRHVKFTSAKSEWDKIDAKGQEYTVETSVPHLLADAIHLYSVIERILR